MEPFEGFSLILFCLASLPIGFLVGCLVCSQAVQRSRLSQAKAQRCEPPKSATANVESVVLQHAETAFRSFCAISENLHRDVGRHGERIAAATTSLGVHGIAPANIELTVARIIEANAWLQDQLLTAQSTIREQSIELEQRMLEANTDGLTGVANRRAFDLELERQLARWRRYGTRFALIMFDIDHFKNVNDRHGHLAGDAVLRAISELIRNNLRDVDFTARYGGEEFAAILPETDHESALIAGDRVRKAIAAARIPWENNRISVTVSVGIAGLSQLDDAAAVTGRADEALYISKRAGRNRTTLCSRTPKPEELAGAPAANQPA